MSAVDDIYDVLADDDDFVEALDGGVYLYKELPANGISHQSLPDAYDTGKKLKPLCVVKGRAVTPTNLIGDPDAQTTSTRQVVELWFYDDKAAGWVDIEAAADLAYGLLQERPTSGVFNIKLVNEVNEERVLEMNDACMLRRDYEVIGRK
jgi:hypothetical protein